MLAAGHGVGLHCDEHVRHSQRNIVWLRRDTARALTRLRLAGVRPALWRTPWGDTGPSSEQVAKENHLRIVGWTVDTHDWRGDCAESMFAATRGELRPGAIVLAHDGIGPGARRADAAETLRLVSLMIDHATATGLTLESLR